MAKVLFVVRFPDPLAGREHKETSTDTVEDNKDSGCADQEKRFDEEKDHLENNAEISSDREEESRCDGQPRAGDVTNSADLDDQKEYNCRLSDGGDDVQSTVVTESDPIVNVNPTPDNLRETNIKNGKANFQMVRLLSQESTSSLLENVKQTLTILHVTGVQWSHTEDNIHLGIFIADYGDQCELIIKRLSMLRIGIMRNSSINIFPASICIEEKLPENVKTHPDREERMKEQVSEFRKSIKSRLVVDQVVASVHGDAVFTFDFLMLVILASFVAVMGLLEDSSVVLVASMLISPLMGPILAAVFGTVIHKSDLISVGVVNELKGLGICILVGFILGFIPACLEDRNYDWRFATEWPTMEMSSRGALRSLPIGILIAVPSGAGVALSVLGGKIGSLVGVAISASLLPPAVNAGLLWANAIVVAISPPQEIIPGNPPPSTAVNLNRTIPDFIRSKTSECPHLINNDYVHIYFCNFALESFILGFVSLSLTILNIACIISMGILVLKLKEVAPIFRSSTEESEKDFFGKDLRIARESYATTKGKSALAMREQWLNEYKTLTSKNKDGDVDDDDDDDDGDEEESDAEQEIDNIIESLQDSPGVREIVDKMPVRPKRWSQTLLSSSSGGSNPSFFTFQPHCSNKDDSELPEKYELPRTDDLSPTDAGLHLSRDNAVYFTVHKFINPRSYMSDTTSYWKKGKLLPKLKLPQESRFMVAKIEEPPQVNRKRSELSTLTEDAGEQMNDQITNESNPLLNLTTTM